MEHIHILTHNPSDRIWIHNRHNIEYHRNTNHHLLLMVVKLWLSFLVVAFALFWMASFFLEQFVLRMDVSFLGVLLKMVHHNRQILKVSVLELYE